MEAVLVLVVVGAVVWYAFARSYKRQEQAAALTDRAQRTVELRFLELFAENPQREPAEYVQIIRDELETAQVRTPAAYQYATIDTVLRLQRTILRSIEREKGAERAELTARALRRPDR